MTENPSVPEPRRDLAMHNDWWASGWDHVLPRQGFPLTMLIGTASKPVSRAPWTTSFMRSSTATGT